LDFPWIIVAILVVTVSLAIAPVYWMRPSPRQRQLARLREYAIGKGLRPELSTVPAALRLAGYEDKLMKYQWYRPLEAWPREGKCWLAMAAKDSAPRKTFSWPRELGYLPGPDTLLTGLDKGAPESLFAVEAGPAGLGFYWHESGDSARIDEILALLQPWLAAYCEQHS
jgi:hypothetical protein